MYTKCPECQTAFRITATVLKQAAGRVRCGGCGKAFNAIEHLSEEPPGIPQPAESGAARGEPGRALLETLDKLAGPEDVRIEDTGIEWRVFGDDDTDSATEHAGARRDPPAQEPPIDVDETAISELGDTATHRAIDTQTALDLEDAAPPDDEPRYDDNTPLPDDYDDEADASVSALRRRAEDFDAPPAAEFVEAQHDLELGEPEDWAGLLSEMNVDGVAAVSGAFSDGTPRDLELEVDESISLEVEQVLAAARGDSADLTEPDEEEDEDLSLEVEEELAAIHSELSFRSPAPPRGAVNDDESADTEIELLDSDEQEIDFSALLDDDPEMESLGAEAELSIEATPEVSSDDDSGDTGGFKFQEPTGEFEANVARAGKALESDETTSHTSAEGEQRSPSEDDEEREKTVNLQIDEELLRAMQDEEFAATMKSEDGSPLVETIIMEGDFIRGSIEAGQRAANTSARHEVPDGSSLADTYMLTREKEKIRFRLPGKGPLAGALVLLLLLAGQYVHYARERLATYGLFNQTLAPVYRTLGSPVRPQWDIRGWQFETTSGSTDEAGSVLTIQSRIANRSDAALPYPLIHVSLTDRWEEIIGSRVLEPNEYLAGNADPRRPLAPGERFTAVITVESPSPDATGFKLNVCYRERPGIVRCAIEDFKR